MSYGATVRLPVPFTNALQHVRDVLAQHGFGVLTEIDVRATMMTKLNADMEDYVILGACNPPLAHRALGADRSVGLLLPCNVVVRADGHDATIVETLDPLVISQLSTAPGMSDIANEVAAKLDGVRAALTPVGPDEASSPGPT